MRVERDKREQRSESTLRTMSFRTHDTNIGSFALSRSLFLFDLYEC